MTSYTGGQREAFVCDQLSLIQRLLSLRETIINDKLATRSVTRNNEAVD